MTSITIHDHADEDGAEVRIHIMTEHIEMTVSHIIKRDDIPEVIQGLKRSYDHR